MAMFRGSVLSDGSEASRLGTEKSGLRTRAASWQGAVETRLSVRIIDGVKVTWATVELCKHAGAGTERVLYDGPISGDPAGRAPFIPMG